MPSPLNPQRKRDSQGGADSHRDSVFHHTCWVFAERGERFEVLLRRGHTSGKCSIYVGNLLQDLVKTSAHAAGSLHDFKLVGPEGTWDAEISVTLHPTSNEYVHELRVSGQPIAPISEDIWPAAPMPTVSKQKQYAHSLQRSVLANASEESNSRTLVLDKAHGDIGITVCNRPSCHAAQGGVLVKGLEAGGLCERSGMHIGDVVMRVNGQPVKSHQLTIALTDMARGTVEYRLWGARASRSVRYSRSELPANSAGLLSLHFGTHYGPGVIIRSGLDLALRKKGVAAGDILLAVSGVPLESPSHAIALLQQESGDEVELVHIPCQDVVPGVRLTNVDPATAQIQPQPQREVPLDSLEA